MVILSHKKWFCKFKMFCNELLKHEVAFRINLYKILEYNTWIQQYIFIFINLMDWTKNISSMETDVWKTAPQLIMKKNKNINLLPESDLKDHSSTLTTLYLTLCPYRVWSSFRFKFNFGGFYSLDKSRPQLSQNKVYVFLPSLKKQT